MIGVPFPEVSSPFTPRELTPEILKVYAVAGVKPETVNPNDLPEFDMVAPPICPSVLVDVSTLLPAETVDVTIQLIIWSTP